MHGLFQIAETDVVQDVPPLNGTYCWGLKQSKCPAQAEGQVRQKAAASTGPDLLNECNVIQYMGQQSHAESRPTC